MNLAVSGAPGLARCLASLPRSSLLFRRSRRMAASPGFAARGSFRGLASNGGDFPPPPSTPSPKEAEPGVNVPVKELFIANQFVAASDNGLTATHSPIDGSLMYMLAEATPEDVERAVTAARLCQDTDEWCLPENAGARAESLRALASCLAGRLNGMAALETADCGKPLVESSGDMAFCVDVLQYYADISPEALQPKELAPYDPKFRCRILAEPIGVVGCITPWNYPLMQTILKVAPALAAGCSVVVKPSPWASMTTLLLGELALEAGLPAGALNIITGGPPGGGAGEFLAADPRLDKLSFTGSGRAGRALLHASADHLRPTSLELGGKGVLVVFEDADMDAAVDWALCGIFMCAGQVCSATSRLLLQESIAAEFTERVAAAAERIVVGDPTASGTQMGPVVSATQHRRVLEAIHRARSEGATLVAGGGVPDNLPPSCEGGWYVEPTVFTDVPTDSSLWRDEVFGPVLAINTFSSEAEAVRAANDTPYGLANGIMSADLERCERVSRQLDSGVVWQNCSQVLFPNTPFGGFKASGFGKENGSVALEEYLRLKSVIGTTEPGHSWQWYGNER